MWETAIDAPHLEPVRAGLRASIGAIKIATKPHLALTIGSALSGDAARWIWALLLDLSQLFISIKVGRPGVFTSLNGIKHGGVHPPHCGPGCAGKSYDATNAT